MDRSPHATDVKYPTISAVYDTCVVYGGSFHDNYVALASADLKSLFKMMDRRHVSYMFSEQADKPYHRVHGGIRLLEASLQLLEDSLNTLKAQHSPPVYMWSRHYERMIACIEHTLVCRDTVVCMLPSLPEQLPPTFLRQTKGVARNRNGQ